MGHDLESEGCRRKADDLLRLAAQAENMAERGRLIDEAGRWHLKALSLSEGGASDSARLPLDLDPIADEPG